MKRTADEENSDDDNSKALIDDEHWVLDLPDLLERNSRYVIKDSMLSCDVLSSYGRMSFKGFNPEIERLRNESETQEVEEQYDSEDVEFAESMTSLSSNLKKKFEKTRRRKKKEETVSNENSDNNTNSPQVVKKKKKKKFLKPKE
ncbi:DgyrCDS6186 [Dimorphilus gyrociliatus]|uniref:DgyrCDS6186 n=1 Tax=Dimorphilus gyrociliatus TaxID=2664684 RepID=A0A7I8VMH2_9ANNE|nr:DgyrCDS6186 [Dimorphilus gyrociliatus]